MKSQMNIFSCLKYILLLKKVYCIMILKFKVYYIMIKILVKNLVYAYRSICKATKEYILKVKLNW